MWAALLIVAVLYLPTALLVERYPEPSPWGSCDQDCPANAFMLLDAEPAFLASWVFPLREAATVALFLLVSLVLARRVHDATPLMRLTLAPVLAVAILRCVGVAAWVLARRFEPESAALGALSWLLALCLPGIALAFFAGQLRMRLFAGSALQRLALRLRDREDTEGLPAVLADVLGDPSLEVAYWIPGRPGRWADANGREVHLPRADSGRSTIEVRRGDGRVAALIYDTALNDQKDFVEAAARFASAGLENERLAAEVDASLRELRESRARIQAAADSERQRIERDLHDGAQQRLVALRIRLEIAADLMREDPERGGTLLRELGAEIEEAIDEVRSLARGIYPPLLADQGLAGALRAAALRAPLQTTIDTDGVGRYSEEIESAVYFCCLEALQNAVKHSRRASHIAVSLLDDGTLSFAVRDDGVGFVVGAATAGRGLTNMRDRLAAVGGELTIDSSPGGGARIGGAIPGAGRG
jgi:signal transduction histidine kinase